MSRNSVPLLQNELVEEIKKNQTHFVEKLAKTDEEWFIVLAQFGSENDALVDVHLSRDYENAAQTANGWDERVNTYMVSTKEFRLWEKIRRENMSLSDKLNEYVNDAYVRIDSQVEAMNSR